MTDADAEIDPKLLEILVCPLTKGPLTLRPRPPGTDLASRPGSPIPSATASRSCWWTRRAASTTGPAPRSPEPIDRHRSSEIRLVQAESALRVTFDDGRRFALPAEYLRVESPSAEVQGQSPTQKVTVPGKAQVGITRLEPVGNYAVRIVFDDGHDTGIYSWDYLCASWARN